MRLALVPLLAMTACEGGPKTLPGAAPPMLHALVNLGPDVRATTPGGAGADGGTDAGGP